MGGIAVYNRQRAVRFDLRWLRRFSEIALPFTLEESADERFALREIDEVEVVIVSDKRIAQVHRDFMNLPDPTDVITFEHGEIVASAVTARECALEFGHSVEAELALYTVHGLLHLNGFEDASSRDANRMRRVQERIWKRCLASLPTPTVIP